MLTTDVHELTRIRNVGTALRREGSATTFPSEATSAKTRMRTSRRLKALGGKLPMEPDGPRVEAEAIQRSLELIA